MGQYYKPVSLDKREFLSAHAYDNGLKLMEHSWVGNHFMSAVLGLLVVGGNWYKTRIVWAGDYDDKELHLDPQHKDINVYAWVDKYGERIKPSKAAKNHAGKTWLVNHTKNEAVQIPKYDKDKWQPHPLSLLTCSGNGRGGGDYEEDNEYTGTWAGDIISLESSKPDDFKEIVPNFIED